MHVVFISPHCDPEANAGEPDSGGQCVYEYQLAKALSSLPDTTIDIFCRQTYQRPDVSQINQNFMIHRIECGPEEFVPKEVIEEVLPEFAQRTLPYLANTREVVIHSHYWDGGKAGLLIQSQMKHKPPMLWTPHSLGSSKRQKFPGQAHEQEYNFIPRLCWENYTCYGSHKVIVSSDEEKQNVVEDYGVEPDRLTIIPPGVDFSELSLQSSLAMRRKYKLPLKGTILLTLGRMARSKGYHYAIQALAALKKIHQSPVSLVICGGSDPAQTDEEKNYLRELKQLAAELDVTGQVIFRPAVPHQQVHELFSAADVVLLFSAHEPFGLVMIEAMAMQKPLVAANEGGPSSVIKHNQTGVLVNVNEPERSAYYIRSLIKDHALATRISQNAYEFVTHTFDWAVKAGQFREQYQLALQRPQSPINDWFTTKYFLQLNLTSNYAVLH